MRRARRRGGLTVSSWNKVLTPKVILEIAIAILMVIVGTSDQPKRERS